MPQPSVRREDPLEIGVSGEPDAEHVEDLALHEIGAAPDGRRAGNALLLVHARLEKEAAIEGRRIDDVDDLEPGLVRRTVLMAIHRRDVGQEFVEKVGIGLEKAERLDNLAGRDPYAELAPEALLSLVRVPEPRFQLRDDGFLGALDR